MRLCFFFFFQAEDGIRDLYVTGVQTCALPISSGRGRVRSHTLPLTRTASAALASPGPIALARSAPVDPWGRRFSLPSGSVTRISAATIGSGSRLGGGSV